MEVSLLRTDNEIEEIYSRQVNTVYRVCYTYLKNQADTEDAVSDTFVKLIQAAPTVKALAYLLVQSGIILNKYAIFVGRDVHIAPLFQRLTWFLG